MEYWDKAKLKRVCRQRQSKNNISVQPLQASVDKFMRKVVIPRKKKLSELGLAWRELLPQEIVEHTSLEKFSRGQLYVKVDTAGHLSELNLFFLARAPALLS